MSRAIKVGDVVAYAPAWLHSTGQHLGEFAHYRGAVLSVQRISARLVVAKVSWALRGVLVMEDGVPWTPSVNILNIARFGTARSCEIPVWASESMNGRAADTRYAREAIDADNATRRAHDERILAEYSADGAE